MTFVEVKIKYNDSAFVFANIAVKKKTTAITSSSNILHLPIPKASYLKCQQNDRSGKLNLIEK